MNILFLTIGRFESVYDSGLYTDLMRKFMKEGHKVYVVSKTEKREKRATHIIEEECCWNLKVQTGNITKSNIIQKGVTTLNIQNKYLKAINKYFGDIKFDLILYSTPPITFDKLISKLKKKNKCKTYLLLKDIFPQNAVDISMLKKDGLNGILYRYFKMREKNMYKTSDYIGCMSKANVEYILDNNSFLQKENVHINPNSIEPRSINLSSSEKYRIKKKYGLPLDKILYIYGGNLGKPQGIDYLKECLKLNENNKNSFILIIGSGTEFNKLYSFFEINKLKNAKLIKYIEKDEYDKVVASADVGLIFLDNRFTIPNFPSRLLSYLEAKLPVIAATDRNTDLGKIIVDNNFGLWCESKDPSRFNELVLELSDVDIRRKKGCNGYNYLKDNYTVDKSYKTIMDKVSK